jgi:hypothetical protein
MVCPALQYFFTLLHKLYDFRKQNIIERKMCAFIFSTNLSEIFHILKRNGVDMIKMCIGLY